MAPFHLRTRFNEPVDNEGPPEFQKQGRFSSTYRPILFLIIFVVALVCFLWMRHMEQQGQQSQILRFELQKLRNAVLIYVQQYGSPPSDLRALANARLRVAGPEDIRMLEGQRLDETGKMVDPFGYPYAYDPSTGIIYSTAPCCKNW